MALRDIADIADDFRQNGCDLITIVDAKAQHVNASRDSAGARAYVGFDEQLLNALLQGPEIARRGKLLLAVSWSMHRVVQDMLNESTAADGGNAADGSASPQGRQRSLSRQTTAKLIRQSTSALDATTCGGLQAVPAPSTLTEADLIAAFRHAVTSENTVDTKVIQLLLDDRRMPCDCDGTPKFDGFAFATLHIPNSAAPDHSESTDLAWRERLASRCPVAWASDGFVDDASPLGLIELLLWAILDGRHELAVCMWKRSENPLRYSLYASQLYAMLAEQVLQRRIDPPPPPHCERCVDD